MGPDTPPPRDSRSSLTYFTDETLQEKVERHLHDIVEADVIQRLQASPSETLDHAANVSMDAYGWLELHLECCYTQEGHAPSPPQSSVC